MEHREGQAPESPESSMNGAETYRQLGRDQAEAEAYTVKPVMDMGAFSRKQADQRLDELAGTVGQALKNQERLARGSLLAATDIVSGETADAVKSADKAVTNSLQEVDVWAKAEDMASAEVDRQYVSKGAYEPLDRDAIEQTARQQVDAEAHAAKLARLQADVEQTAGAHPVRQPKRWIKHQVGRYKLSQAQNHSTDGH